MTVLEIYIAYLVFIIIAAIIYNNLNVNKRMAPSYIILCIAVLTLIAGLRNITVGIDTKSYVYYFEHYGKMNWQKLFRNISGDSEFNSWFILKIIYLLSGGNSTVLFIVVATIMSAALFFLIKNYSDDPFISIIMFVSIGYFHFSMSGMRQTLALAIVIFSYKYVRDRKLLKFLLVLLIAYLFHNSAIIFLIAYPVARLRLGVKHIFIFVSSVAALSFASPFVQWFIFNFLRWERFTLYESGRASLNLSGFFVHLVIFLFCLYYYNRIIKNDARDLSYFNIMFIGLIFLLMTPIMAEFFRIAYYFNIYGIILLTKALKSETNPRFKTFIYSGVTTVFLAYYLFFGYRYAGCVPYRFFWEK